MLLPPSLQSEYGLVWSGDPALNLPVNEIERMNALRVARETGVWTPLVHVGQEPAVFYFVPTHGVARTFLNQEMRANDLRDEAIIELAFRLGVRRSTLTGWEPAFERVKGITILTLASLDALYAYGTGNQARELVIELGALVLARMSQGVPPKS